MFESKLNKGSVNGYAPLDTNKIVPFENLHPILTGATFSDGTFELFYSSGVTQSVTGITSLPSQNGHNGEFLTTNGSNPIWSGITFPIFDASNGLTYDGSNVILGGTLTGATSIDIANNNLTITSNSASEAPNLFLTNNAVQLYTLTSQNGLLGFLAGNGYVTMRSLIDGSSQGGVTNLNVLNQRIEANFPDDNTTFFSVTPNSLTITALANSDTSKFLQADSNGNIYNTVIPVTGWSLSGNSGTNPTINFIGTTDNTNLVFKVNNTISGIIDNQHFNTSFGYSSLTGTTDSNNTAFGYFALNTNLNGFSNNAFGTNSLAANTTGAQNIAIGHLTLWRNTIGNNNTMVGHGAGQRNISGGQNIGVGFGAMYQSLSGNYNTAIGFNALNNAIATNNQIAIGAFAIQSSTGDTGNIGIGDSTLGLLNGGNYNLALGINAGNSIINGSYNINIGAYSSLPNGSNRAFNIGNVLYGTGLYTGTTVSTTAITGSIGIGIINPQYNLDVVGNARFSSGATLNNLIFVSGGTPSTPVDGQLWYEGVNTNIKMKRAGEENSIIFDSNNSTFQGSGDRFVVADDDGNLTSTLQSAPTFVTDSITISAITNAVYNSGNNYTAILPLTGNDIFNQGQLYKNGDYLYLAISDNASTQIPLAESGTIINASNGLTYDGSNIILGGTLTGDTNIETSGNTFTINGSYTPSNFILDLEPEYVDIGIVNADGTLNDIEITDNSFAININSNSAIYINDSGIQFADFSGIGFAFISSGVTNFSPLANTDSNKFIQADEQGNLTNVTIPIEPINASNGLTYDGTNVILGGTLTGNTNIISDSNHLTIGSYNSGDYVMDLSPDSIILGVLSNNTNDYNYLIIEHDNTQLSFNGLNNFIFSANSFTINTAPTNKAFFIATPTTLMTSALANSDTGKFLQADSGGTISSVSVNIPTINSQLIAWTNSNAWTFTAITRDTNEAIVTASIVWPDGATGVFTTLSASTSFLGAIDSFSATYVPSVGTSHTITQPTLTRDAAGAVIAQPVPVVT